MAASVRSRLGFEEELVKEVHRGFHSHFPRTEDREYNCSLTLMINVLHGAGPSQYASHFVIGVNNIPFDLRSSGKAPVILGQLISCKQVEINSVELSMGVVTSYWYVCMCVYVSTYFAHVCACV